MKRPLAALAAAALAAIASALPIYAFPPQTSVAATAVAWLHTQQAADGSVAGSVSRTEETVWGLTANKLALTDFSTSGKTPIDSLRTHLADEEKSAGNIGSLVMAVSAAGLDPTSFGGHNLLQDLQCTYDAQTGAYNTQLFNDALAVLALPDGTAPAKAKAFLANQQQADGGWEFQAGFGTDTNTTALVVMALASAGGLESTVKEKALAYFKLHQKPSGGFEYSAPFAPPGDSDPNSDALVVEALLATGENPTAAKWSMVDQGANAVSDLLTFRYENGGFGFNRPDSSATAAPDAASTTQALPALASAYLPVTRTTGVMPTSCPPTAPSATAPPVAPSQLPPTGSPPIAVLLGFVLFGFGWRLRQRRA